MAVVDSQPALMPLSVRRTIVLFVNRAVPMIVLPIAIVALVAACGTAQSGSGPVADATGESPPLSGGIGPSTSPSTRRNEGADVIVVVTWDGPVAGATFEVKLDTHSVDLDAVDLADTTLRNDRGESLAAAAWIAPKGGNHREGRLSFAGDAEAFLTGTTWVEVDLRGIGGVPERTFRWEVGG